MPGSFPGSSVVKKPPANAGDMGLIPDPGRSQEDGTTKPMCHNYWACALDPQSLNNWAHLS